MINKVAAEKALDRLWQSVIKLKYKKCVRCGSAYNLEAAHIFIRKRKSTRWEADNGLTLCTECHVWAHANKTPFENMCRKILGDARYDELQRLSQTIIKPCQTFYEEREAKLQKCRTQIYENEKNY